MFPDNKQKKWNYSLRSMVLIAFGIILCTPCFVRADEVIRLQWGTVGSAGEVDDADEDKIRKYGGVVELIEGLVGVADIRYNIPEPPTKLVESIHGYQNPDYYIYPVDKVSIRFLDNGTAAKVNVILKEYNLVTGEVRKYLVARSNAVPSYEDFQCAEFCMRDWPILDFDFNTYYLHVFLVQRNTSARAALGMIMVNASDMDGCYTPEDDDYRCPQ